MIYKVYSTVFNQSLEQPIEIEVHMSGGIPQINLVGLPDQAVKESKERLTVALAQQDLLLPNKRFTVNFNPPDIKKQGSHLDLPIAIGLMLSSGKVDSNLRIGAIGNVNLLGELHDFPMAFALLDSLQSKKLDMIIIPKSLIRYKCLYPNRCIVGVDTLKSLKDLIHKKSAEAIERISFLQMEDAKLERIQAKEVTVFNESMLKSDDFNEVKGQEIAKLALIYAIAGNHNLLMYGPPGTGKTMLASRIKSIQPCLEQSEGLEMQRRMSISSGMDYFLDEALKEPFRAPHHSCSQSAMLGGMRANMIGEAALSHNGVLFMDELPEFKRDVIEGLRGPIESGVIHLSKAHYKSTMQAKFTLIATANPCPCGYHGFSSKCTCNEREIERYFSKISGPILDRFDMTLQVSYRESNLIMDLPLTQKNLDSQTMLEHVLRIRNLQLKRYGNSTQRNGYLGAHELESNCKMTVDANKWFVEHVSPENNQNSYRRQSKIVKLARTIADFYGSEIIEKSHIIEAFFYNKREVISRDHLNGRESLG